MKQIGATKKKKQTNTRTNQNREGTESYLCAKANKIKTKQLGRTTNFWQRFVINCGTCAQPQTCGGACVRAWGKRKSETIVRQAKFYTTRLFVDRRKENKTDNRTHKHTHPYIQFVEASYFTNSFRTHEHNDHTVKTITAHTRTQIDGAFLKVSRKLWILRYCFFLPFLCLNLTLFLIFHPTLWATRRLYVFEGPDELHTAYHTARFALFLHVGMKGGSFRVHKTFCICFKNFFWLFFLKLQIKISHLVLITKKWPISTWDKYAWSFEYLCCQ